jgi:integrase
MARAFNKLAAKQVEKISGKGMHGDGGGLWLKVTDTGTKSWVFRYGLNGKRKNMGLGPYPAISLASAREKAASCRTALADGKDPRLERAKEDSGPQSFAECAEQFINTNAAGWKNAKHAQQWRNTLTTYAYPVIGGLNVADIETHHILAILEPIWSTKTETASRVRGRIDRVMNWAKTRGLFEGQNPAQWLGHLENVLPARSKVQKVKHFEALPYQEIGDFMSALRARESMSSLGLEFLILTAARTSEVMLATWDEIDGDTWTIPAERTKMAREHRVPLSKQAQAVLATVRDIGGEYIFPGQKKGRPLSNMAFLKQLERMGYGHLTAHGFRSTFKDWAAEMTAYANEVSEMALAHVVANRVEAAYRRGDLYEKRVRLMQDWADYCDQASTEAPNVVPIR